MYQTMLNILHILYTWWFVNIQWFISRRHVAERARLVEFIDLCLRWLVNRNSDILTKLNDVLSTFQPSCNVNALETLLPRRGSTHSEWVSPGRLIVGLSRGTRLPGLAPFTFRQTCVCAQRRCTQNVNGRSDNKTPKHERRQNTNEKQSSSNNQQTTMST